MTVPVRLDVSEAKLRPSENEDALSAGGSSGAIKASERQRQMLFGVWMVAAAVVGIAFLLHVLSVDSWFIGALCALVTAVPASMALLRGVVDAVSPSGRLPKYTTNTAIWLACYVVAAAGLLFAFVA